MSKILELDRLRDTIDLEVHGKENIPSDYPCVIISNHNRLLDIFYLPLAFDKDIVSLVSARLVYKQDKERLSYINEYLNVFPIEAHGGPIYSNMGINDSSRFLDKGISISIFPEGAYIDDTKHVYKGRTGGARMLFDSLKRGKYAYLLPVSVDVKSDTELDNYVPSKNDRVIIDIRKPIIPNKFYQNFCVSNCDTERNKVLHDITDFGMKEIAASLGREYVDEYIKLNPKGTVIFQNGETIDTNKAQDEEYIKRYGQELRTLRLSLTKSINFNYKN